MLTDSFNQEYLTDRQRRQEEYQNATKQAEQAYKELQKWKEEEIIQNNLAQRLKKIRETLGLDVTNFVPQAKQYLENPQSNCKFQQSQSGYSYSQSMLQVQQKSLEMEQQSINNFNNVNNCTENYLEGSNNQNIQTVEEKQNNSKNKNNNNNSNHNNTTLNQKKMVEFENTFGKNQDEFLLSENNVNEGLNQIASELEKLKPFIVNLTNRSVQNEENCIENQKNENQTLILNEKDHSNQVTQQIRYPLQEQNNVDNQHNCFLDEKEVNQINKQSYQFQKQQKSQKLVKQVAKSYSVEKCSNNLKQNQNNEFSETGMKIIRNLTEQQQENDIDGNETQLAFRLFDLNTNNQVNGNNMSKQEIVQFNTPSTCQKQMIFKNQSRFIQKQDNQEDEISSIKKINETLLQQQQQSQPNFANQQQNNDISSIIVLHENEINQNEQMHEEKIEKINSQSKIQWNCAPTNDKGNHELDKYMQLQESNNKTKSIETNNKKNMQLNQDVEQVFKINQFEQKFTTPIATENYQNYVSSNMVQLFKQIESYQSKIAELQNAMRELHYSIQEKAKNERQLKIQINNMENNSNMKLDEAQTEIKNLKLQISQLEQSKELLKSGDHEELKSYILQLEMDLTLSKEQITQLVLEKTELQTRFEEQEKNQQHIVVKLSNELENKYARQFEDLQYVIENLKYENEILVGIQNKKNSSQQIEKNFRSNEKKKQQKYTKSGKHQNKNNNLNDLVQEYGGKITSLLDEKYELQEKIEWLEFQLKQATTGSVIENSIQQKNQPQISQLAVFQRRLKILQENLLYYKTKAFQLSNNYYKILSQLKQENETFKQQLLIEQKNFFCECDILLKSFSEVAQGDALELRQHIDSQTDQLNLAYSKIAELRGKLKSLQMNNEDEKKGKKHHKKDKMSQQYSPLQVMKKRQSYQ